MCIIKATQPFQPKQWTLCNQTWRNQMNITDFVVLCEIIRLLAVNCLWWHTGYWDAQKLPGKVRQLWCMAQVDPGMDGRDRYLVGICPPSHLCCFVKVIFFSKLARPFPSVASVRRLVVEVLLVLLLLLLCGVSLSWAGDSFNASWTQLLNWCRLI